MQPAELIVWIRDAQLQRIVLEADHRFPLETGGVLTGYVHEHHVVVEHVIGPGPRAAHRAARFEPDHDWQCQQIDLIFDESRGACTYLGDWHTHPAGKPQTSLLDRRTLAGITASFKGALRPIMVIGGGKPGDWAWAAHAHRASRLGRLWPRSEACDLRGFERP
jgi:integrative and conjugative element protein (TIGR02256 family)